MRVKTTDRPDLLDKAKQLGYHVEANATHPEWLGKFILINPDGDIRFTDNTEESCWIKAMWYADMWIHFVENK